MQEYPTLIQSVSKPLQLKPEESQRKHVQDSRMDTGRIVHHMEITMQEDVVMTIKVEEIGAMEIIMGDLEMVVVEGVEMRMNSMGVETRETMEVRTRWQLAFKIEDGEGAGETDDMYTNKLRREWPHASKVPNLFDYLNQVQTPRGRDC
jgi:hypothetical protein